MCIEYNISIHIFISGFIYDLLYGHLYFKYPFGALELLEIADLADLASLTLSAYVWRPVLPFFGYVLQILFQPFFNIIFCYTKIFWLIKTIVTINLFDILNTIRTWKLILHHKITNFSINLFAFKLAMWCKYGILLPFQWHVRVFFNTVKENSDMTVGSLM